MPPPLDLYLHRFTVCACTLPVCVCDAYDKPHSKCVRLGVRPSLLYSGAHGRGIMETETNLLRSETRDKRNPTSSERDGQRGWAEAEEENRLRTSY